MARTKNPAPHAARSAVDTATDPAPAPVAPAAGDSPAAAVLAALSAEPAGAAVAVIAGHAGISVAAARQALIAHEKAGTATRVKGSRPGIADTWKPAAATAAPADDAPPADAPGAGGSPETPGKPAPAPAFGGTAEGGEAEAGPAQEPDPAVTAEAAANVLAIAQAADEAGRALAAGDLDAALAALDATRDQAAQGRRVIKAAASGRHAPGHPARRAAGPGRGAPAQVPRRHLHPAPDWQGAHPVGRRGRQRPGQAGQPRHRADGHRQAPQLPARLRGPGTRPGLRRRPRHQRGDCAQRRVTRGTRQRAAGTQLCRPGRTTWDVPAPGRPAVPPGVTPSRRAARPPFPARYIRALTCTVPRQVHSRYARGTRRTTGGNQTSCNNRVALPRQHQFPGSA